MELNKNNQNGKYSQVFPIDMGKIQKLSRPHKYWDIFIYIIIFFNFSHI